MGISAVSSADDFAEGSSVSTLPDSEDPPRLTPVEVSILTSVAASVLSTDDSSPDSAELSKSAVDADSVFADVPFSTPAVDIVSSPAAIVSESAAVVTSKLATFEASTPSSGLGCLLPHPTNKDKHSITTSIKGRMRILFFITQKSPLSRQPEY